MEEGGSECLEGDAYWVKQEMVYPSIQGLTASVKVSSELRPCHRSISSWQSGPVLDQHFEGDRKTH